MPTRNTTVPTANIHPKKRSNSFIAALARRRAHASRRISSWRSNRSVMARSSTLADQESVRVPLGFVAPFCG
jgi:hypothetical protein